MSGFYSGTFTSGEIKNANDGEYVFIQDPINLNDLIEKNYDIVKFESIKEMRLSEFGEYYFRYIGDKIKLLRNQELITYLQTQEKEMQPYYDKDKIKSLGTIKQSNK